MVAMGLLPIFRTEELRRVEAAARGQPLMERAGLAAADVARRHGGRATDPCSCWRGPATTAATHSSSRADCASCSSTWPSSFAAIPRGCRRTRATPIAPSSARAERPWTDIPAGWRGSLIVDGLFGIGLARPLAADYASLVERANGSGIPILALDVPSGLDADTGAARGPTIRAAATATFIALKPGLLTGDGIDFCGDVSVHALGLESEATAPAAGHRLDWTTLAADLPAVLARRRRNVHKGSFGTLAIVGGADGMVGAPLLAGRARTARRRGQGVDRLCRRESAGRGLGPARADVAAGRCRSWATGASAMVCGPGLGAAAVREGDPGAGDRRTGAARARRRRAERDRRESRAGRRPSQDARRPRSRHPIRPKPRACSARTPRAVQADRLGAAQALAARLHAAVVVKGAGSVLAYPDGTWDINASGNPGLASAGTGDVLAGFVGAFLAQGLDAKTALRLAVCVHGAAADARVRAGCGPLGLTAVELVTAARQLLNAR